MYRLRERNPSDLPNPIPPGCDREERKKRVEKEGGRESFIIKKEGGRRSEEKDQRRERRREERLEPEHEWRRRKEREARGNKENLHREQRENNREQREKKENLKKENRGEGQVMRRHTSHKREWRESFAIKKDEMDVVDSNGFSNADISVSGADQSFRREKRKMSSKEMFVEQGKVSSPRVGDSMESASSWSRSYTSQERGEALKHSPA